MKKLFCSFFVVCFLLVSVGFIYATDTNSHKVEYKIVNNRNGDETWTSWTVDADTHDEAKKKVKRDLEEKHTGSTVTIRGCCW